MSLELAVLEIIHEHARYIEIIHEHARDIFWGGFFKTSSSHSLLTESLKLKMSTYSFYAGKNKHFDFCLNI